MIYDWLVIWSVTKSGLLNAFNNVLECEGYFSFTVSPGIGFPFFFLFFCDRVQPVPNLINSPPGAASQKKPQAEFILYMDNQKLEWGLLIYVHTVPGTWGFGVCYLWVLNVSMNEISHDVSSIIWILLYLWHWDPHHLFLHMIADAIVSIRSSFRLTRSFLLWNWC